MAALGALPSCLTIKLQPHAIPRVHASRRTSLNLKCAATESRGTAAPQQRQTQNLQRPIMAQFDSALRAGHLDSALAALHLATVATGGAAVTLLQADRNRAFIQCCFQRGRPDKVLEYLQLLHPAVAPWVSVMREAGKGRDTETVQRVLAARQAAGLPLDPRSATAAIAGLGGSGGRLADALDVFCRAWEQQECRSVEVANAAISACANQGNWEAAQEVVSTLEREGIPPDAITYNSLIKAAAASGLLPEAVQSYRQLTAAGLRTSTFTYAALFTAAAKARQRDANWMLRILEEMEATGVQPNSYVVSALFTAASYATCTPAQLDRLFAMLAQLRSLEPANDTVYSALFTLIQRHGLPERAVDVWRAMKEDGTRLTPHLYSSLFTACAPVASPALVEVALEAAHAMLQSWQQVVARGRPRPQQERDMLVAYNALLHLLGTDRELQPALGLYQSMRRNGPAPDTVTYNTLISAAAKGGHVQAAMRAFSDMVDADIEPTEHTAGSLLNCYAKARDAASAKRVFEGMAQLGIRPNLEMYTSLMDACVQAGGKQWTEFAFQLADEMRREGLAPSAVTYGCLLAACEKGGDVNRAFSLYQQACDEGVVPSDQMYDMLISMCTEAERLEEAVDLVKRLARRSTSSSAGSQSSYSGSHHSSSSNHLGSPGGGSNRGVDSSHGSPTTTGGLHEHTLNSLIRALCGKYVDRALRLLSLCQTMGMRPSRATYLSLITGCAKASRSAASYDLYRSMRAQGMEADSASGSALITSLCHANQLEVAETVYNDMLARAWRHEQASTPSPKTRRGGLSHSGRTPDAQALAALIQAFAATGNLRTAAKYYQQLRRVGTAGLAAVSVSHRRMWEVLIENYCRQNNVKQALQVFDDWKVARDDWMAAQQQHVPNSEPSAATPATPAAAAPVNPGAGSSSGNGKPAKASKGNKEAVSAASGSAPAAAALPPAAARYPKLSNVSLAFLEACCRSEPDCEWRVYDVCAVMRQQKELKRQAGLARPQKQSHHFAPA